MSVIARANANASRAFFVRMLTRDISLEDCILDLVDNSVDSAWKISGKEKLGLNSGPDFSNFNIEILFDEKIFQITDNCGGMSLDSAKNYAFTFGRIDEDPEDEAEFSIGVYGIGLKRAIFKLGNIINIKSKFRSKTNEIQSFQVPINVDTWVKGLEKNWDFPIEESDDLKDYGLEITVKNLTKSCKDKFLDPAFEDYLYRTISRDYALHFHRGLNISVNGRKIVGEHFDLLNGGDFSPQFADYIDEQDGKNVSVEIVAGFAFPPPEDIGPQENRGGREVKSGWYVACNGRIVLAADKTSLTVWGNDFPMWHSQYTGFFGLIMFTSDHTEVLPLTTTKRSVESSSEIYRRSRSHMREATRAWTDYTNAKKGSVEDAKQAEAKAQPQSIFSIIKSQSVSLPKLSKPTRKLTTSIQFSVEKSRLKELAEAFGNVAMSNVAVGQNAFDFAYEELVGEDE